MSRWIPNPIRQATDAPGFDFPTEHEEEEEEYYEDQAEEDVVDPEEAHDEVPVDVDLNLNCGDEQVASIGSTEDEDDEEDPDIAIDINYSRNSNSDNKEQSKTNNKPQPRSPKPTPAPTTDKNKKSPVQVSVKLPAGVTATVDVPHFSSWYDTPRKRLQIVGSVVVFLLLLIVVPGASVSRRKRKNKSTSNRSTSPGEPKRQSRPSSPTPADPMNVAAPSPTLAPRTQDEVDGIVSLIQNKTLSGQTLRYPLTDITDWTREEWALEWLIEDDPARLNATSPADQLWLVERYALATLYLYSYNLVDDYQPWLIDYGWLNELDECNDWYGVSCTEFDLGETIGLYATVTSVSLGNNGLIGILPPDVGLLSYLQEFQINTNAVTGTLPESIGMWTNMQAFDVSFNYNLAGSIPSSIQDWINLESAGLTYTELTGTLPPGICLADQIPCSIECSCCTFPTCLR